MSRSWLCKCASLDFEWDGGMRRYTRSKGYSDIDYTCAVKSFFGFVRPQRHVGGWKCECENRECAQMTFDEKEGKYKCKERDRETGWCDMCIWTDETEYERRMANKCTCEIDKCPFFKPRTLLEWRQDVLTDRVPFVTRGGRLRPEAISAKKHFKLSDAEMDALLKSYRKVQKAAKEAVEKWSDRNDANAGEK